MKDFTKQELRVLNLLVQGFNTREIAEKLNVSIHNAKVNTEAIRRKLDAKNRVQAVVKAITHNIIEV